LPLKNNYYFKDSASPMTLTTTSTSVNTLTAHTITTITTMTTDIATIATTLSPSSSVDVISSSLRIAIF